MGKCQSCGREKLNINLLQGKDRPVLHFQYPNAYLHYREDMVDLDLGKASVNPLG